jgi:hypothetical protein
MTASCKRVSGPNTVPLLELYSSEGCNSCPPADQFLSAVVASGLAPDQVVPVALHVDYWDRLGWTDRYASPVFTQRQYWLSEKNTGRRSAYTPELFIGGREWRDWGSPELSAALTAIHARPAQAEISLNIQNDSTVKIEASVRALVKSDDIKLYLALAQDGLISAVKAGENRGVTLHHDAVARQWAGPYAQQISLEFSKPLEGSDAGRLSVIAFAQNVRTGEVVQALAVPLPCKS